MVTFGATFLYAAMSGSQPTFASVMDVSLSVTGLPLAPAPLSPELLLSCVPLPQAATPAASSVATAPQDHRRQRVELVIIRTLLLVRSDFQYSVAVSRAVRAVEKP